MAQIAMSRLFHQNTTSSVRQCILRSVQIRSYASKSAIPTFAPSSSEELNNHLDRFRSEVFIPLGLSKRQRKSIFKPKYAQKLEHEPVTVNISQTEEYTLKPQNRHEMPSKREAVAILDKMFECKDYSNVVPFLSGLHMANYVLSNNRWEYIIRKASQAGKLSIILECARQSNRTGLSLADQNVSRRLFLELHQAGMRADATTSETTDALKLAQEAASLMDWPEHSVQDIQKDPKHQPFVIGTLLELSAACALTGKGDKNLARSYAQKLDAAWSRGNFKKGDSPLECQIRLEENLAVYNGMRLSMALDKDAPETAAFKGRSNELKSTLIACLNNVKNRQVLLDKVSEALLEEHVAKKA